MNDDSVYKVLILGDSSVGKTCFLLKYTDKVFNEVYMSTIGLDYRLKTLTLKSGKKVKLQIWDTAGQDRFRTITKNYYKGAHGIILIYDVTNTDTYDNVENWISQIKEEASPNVVIYLVGNKVDMEDKRKVTTEEGQKVADENNLPFIETSAKSDINVNETFDNLVEKMDSVFSNLEKKDSVSISGNNLNKDNNKKKCC
jgi:small GTP-binding protein